MCGTSRETGPSNQAGLRRIALRAFVSSCEKNIHAKTLRLHVSSRANHNGTEIESGYAAGSYLSAPSRELKTKKSPARAGEGHLGVPVGRVAALVAP